MAKLATLGAEGVDSIILYIFTPGQCLKCQFQDFSKKQSMEQVVALGPFPSELLDRNAAASHRVLVTTQHLSGGKMIAQMWWRWSLEFWLQICFNFLKLALCLSNNVNMHSRRARTHLGKDFPNCNALNKREYRSSDRLSSIASIQRVLGPPVGDILESKYQLLVFKDNSFNGWG